MNLAKAVSLITALLIVTPVWPTSTVALIQVTGTSFIESDNSSVKSFFISLWGKLKSLSPKSSRQVSDHNIVVTAGVRGAESVDTLLIPYWKDDLSEDLEYTGEVELFAKGNDLATVGDIENAIITFEDFIDNYPSSDLLPNAKFALGIAYGETGEQGQAVRILNEFVDAYPSHVLLADAKQLLELIN
jgi:TolA-binding protein